MHEVLLHALRRQRSILRSRWETLLRSEPASSPLANPDILVLMMDWTLDEWEAAMRRPASRRRRPAGSANLERGDCPCGMNPLLRYFHTAELALDEMLAALPIPAGEGEPAIFAREAFVADVRRSFKVVADREIETFCAVCRQHQRSSTPARVESGASVTFLN